MPTAWASEEDPLWSKPCLAYNVHAELDDACRDDLVQVQESLRLPSSWALRCPPASLQVSVATMLSVRDDYGTSKDVICAQWGRQWCDSLPDLVAGLQAFVAGRLSQPLPAQVGLTPEPRPSTHGWTSSSSKLSRPYKTTYARTG